jgi:hypothetical protein
MPGWPALISLINSHVTDADSVADAQAAMHVEMTATAQSVLTNRIGFMMRYSLRSNILYYESTCRSKYRRS